MMHDFSNSAIRHLVGSVEVAGWWGSGLRHHLQRFVEFETYMTTVPRWAFELARVLGTDEPTRLDAALNWCSREGLADLNERRQRAAAVLTVHAMGHSVLVYCMEAP